MKIVLVIGCLLAWCHVATAAECVELPACHGCGCRGGPGYRAPDGHCVGFRDLTRVCGANPASACTFENAPNTGLNRGCTVRPGRTPLPAAPADQPPAS